MVLPASMWAMIPMLRSARGGYSRATSSFSGAVSGCGSELAPDARNPLRPGSRADVAGFVNLEGVPGYARVRVAAGIAGSEQS